MSLISRSDFFKHSIMRRASNSFLLKYRMFPLRFRLGKKSSFKIILDLKLTLGYMIFLSYNIASVFTRKFLYRGLVYDKLNMISFDKKQKFLKKMELNNYYM